MKYIVTGGAGFIGSNIVDTLIERGDEVHVIDNLSNGSKEFINPKATFHNVDIRNLETIKPLFVGIDGVFHLAALPRVSFSIEFPIESHDVNVNGTLNVLIASQEAKVKRIVFSASSSAYGDQLVMPLVETMYPSPKSPYALHKLTGEFYMKTWSEVYGIETVSLRYFNVYGPRQSGEGAYALVIARFLKQKSEGKKMTITGDGLQTRDFTHVRDVVKANLLAMESQKVGKGESINIGTGHNHSVLEIAKLLEGEYEFIDARLEPRNTLANNTKAKELLGWEPKEDFNEALQELLVE
jgi:nucleoside-diphosphate-sugar epimerase